MRDPCEKSIFQADNLPDMQPPRAGRRTLRAEYAGVQADLPEGPFGPESGGEESMVMRLSDFKGKSGEFMFSCEPESVR